MPGIDHGHSQGKDVMLPYLGDTLGGYGLVCLLFYRAQKRHLRQINVGLLTQDAVTDCGCGKACHHKFYGACLPASLLAIKKKKKGPRNMLSRSRRQRHHLTNSF